MRKSRAEQYCFTFPTGGGGSPPEEQGEPAAPQIGKLSAKDSIRLGYFSSGGMVPSGTDTRLAMLTPREFVVNREATAANLPALQAMNGRRPDRMASGGLVWGEAPGQGGDREEAVSSRSLAGLKQFTKSFQSAISEFQAPVAQLRASIEALSGFGEKAGALAATLDRFGASAKVE